MNPSRYLDSERDAYFAGRRDAALGRPRSPAARYSARERIFYGNGYAYVGPQADRLADR